MPDPDVVPRRERLRAEALADIRRHGYEQIAAGGPAALSLNGIAKAMGMSGPALYRYFASRDELLATLVTESFEDLAQTLEAAASAATGSAAERLRAAVVAYRTWGRTSPERYRLVFGSTYGSGELDPERIIPAAARSMAVLLAGLAELDPDAPGPTVQPPALRREIQRWGKVRAGDQVRDPGVLLLGLLAWSRIHGIVSLEIEGFYEQVGVDPGLLFDAEVEHLMAQRAQR
ncbi:TetR/AcrR family transcriptional regulator [Baekduia sp. Peel2402]|uniref:TetR/AcrR family transcriptional regulator n=1 Tax=Baekduia sp. Peel2402 TaxID=3458296 RepID=UPI00403EB23B